MRSYGQLPLKPAQAGLRKSDTLRELAESLEAAQRVTVDVNVLLTQEGLDQFIREFVGRIYGPAFERARKSFRSSKTGVRIDISLSGEYPGDGMPKAVSFPHPSEAAFERDGICYLKLVKLIELKLASGLSAAHRGRDLVDIQDLIRETKLPLDLAEKLDESVCVAYRDLWAKAQIVDPLQG